jgi:hypothetical protein
MMRRSAISGLGGCSCTLSDALVRLSWPSKRWSDVVALAHAAVLLAAIAGTGHTQTYEDLWIESICWSPELGFEGWWRWPTRPLAPAVARRGYVIRLAFVIEPERATARRP